MALPRGLCSLFSVATYDLLVLGSSSTEVFDYIFGKNPNYYPYWASAWSCRGLAKTENIEYVAEITKNVSKDANVILNFGNVDIDYNLRFKLHKEGFTDFDTFTAEMIAALLNLQKNLIRLGFKEKRIYAFFASPPVRLDYDYWLADDVNCYPAPTRLRGKVLWEFSKGVAKQMKTINLLERFSDYVRYNGEPDFYPALSGDFMRRTPDHHPNYILTKDIIWDYIKDIDGMISKSRKQPIALYPHQGFHINDLKVKKMARPRTTPTL